MATYFLGFRKGVSKSSGNWFGCVTYLSKNQYGQYVSSVSFWESEEACEASEIELCELGTPIKAFSNPSTGQLVALSVREDLVPLEFDRPV